MLIVLWRLYNCALDLKLSSHARKYVGLGKPYAVHVAETGTLQADVMRGEQGAVLHAG